MRLFKFLVSGAEFGPFTEQQVRQYIAENYLEYTDLAMEQGDTEWQPVRDILARQPKIADKPKPIPLSQMKTARIGDPPLPPREVRKQQSVPIPKVVIPKIVTEGPGIQRPAT